MEKSNLQILTNGIIKENPVLVLVLGTCPTLAVTTMAKNAIGMGLAATFVLLGSNIVISLLKKVIPDKVRIPCYIVVIAGFVTLLSALLQAYAQDVYSALGIYIPLIVVNCVILGRAEAFAMKNKPIISAFDGAGMGLGFTFALVCIGAVRELLGAGSIFGVAIMPASYQPISIFILAPGAFFVLACLTALQNKLKMPCATNGSAKGKKAKKACCGDCASCAEAKEETEE